MQENSYTLMWKNLEVGDLYVKRIAYPFKGTAIYSLKFQYVPRTIGKHEPTLSYPPGLYHYKAKGSTLVLDTTYDPASYVIESWLQSRIFPEDREDSEVLLSSLGISMYQTWWINQITHAATFEDYYWLNDGTLRYEEFHPRYFLETGRMSVYASHNDHAVSVV